MKSPVSSSRRVPSGNGTMFSAEWNTTDDAGTE